MLFSFMWLTQYILRVVPVFHGLISDTGRGLSSAEWSVPETSLRCSWEVWNLSVSSFCIFMHSATYALSWNYLKSPFEKVSFAENQRLNYWSCCNLCHALRKWAFWGIHWQACHGIYCFLGCFHGKWKCGY